MILDKVPYFSQRDNASGQGYRECFSSSCAMIAAFFGKVGSDDEYNKIRSRHGDTIYYDNHLLTLRDLGLKARFQTDGTIKDLIQLIKKGSPVAVGWLHHGHVSAPVGGGHWSVVVGYEDVCTIHNDPYGEANIVGGGYLNSNGKHQRYSDRNWGRRWMVDGEGSGWFLYCY